MSAISIQKLHKSFGSFKALSGISLEVKAGKIFGFLGPNGAGKTTTISCMLDLLHPDAGTITIDGYDSRTQNVELKKNTAYVPADPYFYPNWTGKAHLDYIEKIRGRAEMRDELIAGFEFNEQTPVRNLSTGNKQKLALIIAIMQQPRVLILDEPTRGLDPLLQNKFYQYIRMLKEQETAVFMSSHNLAEVESVCERVGIIKSGNLVEVAGINDLQDKRMHLVSVTFAGAKKPTRQDFKGTDKDIEIVSSTDDHFELKIAGDLNQLLQLLSKYQVSNLNITRASLEDIFMEFYK